jgi:hypothetical protein
MADATRTRFGDDAGDVGRLVARRGLFTRDRQRLLEVNSPGRSPGAGHARHPAAWRRSV